MASFISNFANKICSRFPQNEHAIKASAVEFQVQGLTEALSDKTGTVFKSKVAEIKNNLKSEKETCLNCLTRLNGEFFQDPKATLKKAWDAVVTNVQSALNFKIESRSELESMTSQLKLKPDDQTAEKAESSIYYYTQLEKTRDNAETRLNEIISVEKTDSLAPPSENDLRERQKELCGNYYQDPNSLLDKAWKAYQEALAENPDSIRVPALLEKYNHLENERKRNEIHLEHLNSIAPAAPDRNIEVLTAKSINDEIISLQKEKIDEVALTRIDWKKALVATATALAPNFSGISSS